MGGAKSGKALDIGRMSEEMHGEDGADAPSAREVTQAPAGSLALLSEKSLELAGIKTEPIVYVDEKRLGAAMRHAVGGGDKAYGGADDEIARGHAKRMQRDVYPTVPLATATA